MGGCSLRSVVGRELLPATFKPATRGMSGRPHTGWSEEGTTRLHPCGPPVRRADRIRSEHFGRSRARSRTQVTRLRQRDDHPCSFLAMIHSLLGWLFSRGFALAGGLALLAASGAHNLDSGVAGAREISRPAQLDLACRRFGEISRHAPAVSSPAVPGLTFC
jgi:hypothetical protein